MSWVFCVPQSTYAAEMQSESIVIIEAVRSFSLRNDNAMNFNKNGFHAKALTEMQRTIRRHSGHLGIRKVRRERNLLC